MNKSGGILIVALLSLGVLALIATASLYQVGNRHATTYHSLSWNEALASAETGADFAMNAMNLSLTDPATAWTGWTPADASTFPKTWVPAIGPHKGEGNNKVYSSVRVDNAIADRNGQPWYRVRATGVAEVAGTCRAGIEGAALTVGGVKNHRGVLRKSRFTGDLTGGVLRLPQVARTIEVMAAPVNARLLVRWLSAQNEITMSGTGIIDSFDSADTAKSTAAQYNPAKRQMRGDIATNASGNLSNLNGGTVWGNASSNGGAIQNTGNVHGSVFNNFSTVLPPVTKPAWSAVNITPNAINDPPGGMTLVGGPAGSPQNYKVSSLNIIASGNPLVLAPHVAGQESYVNIWVTGATSVTGTGYIQQMPGVHVAIYSEQNITLSGGGIVNQTNVARNLQIYGVTPTVGSCRFTLSGTATFIGVLDAPAFDISISGSGAFIGAAIGQSATLSGTGDFHYDEDLGNLAIGPATSYQFASWVEDVR